MQWGRHSLRKLSPWAAQGLGAPWCFPTDLPGSSLPAAGSAPRTQEDCGCCCCTHKNPKPAEHPWAHEVSHDLSDRLNAWLNETQLNGSFYFARLLLVLELKKGLHAEKLFFFFFLQSVPAGLEIAIISYKSCSSERIVHVCCLVGFLFHFQDRFTQVKNWFLFYLNS